MTHFIKFKTKIREMEDGRKYFHYKKSIGRRDCDMRPCDHTYYNSDLFPAILRRSYEKATEMREWSYLDELPKGVVVEGAEGFLATVIVEFESDSWGLRP